MSYDEHLISMAGGDGEPLDQIQRRINDCQSYKFGMRNADKLAHEDAPYLLALVRELEARLGRVEAVHKPKSWTKYGIPCFDEFDSPTARINGCTCGNEHYPCPTIAALTATEGA